MVNPSGKNDKSSEELSPSCELNLENTMIERILKLDEQLETHFKDKLIPAPFLTRKIVSFQGNKTKPRYRWYKYKEAFSADLVDYLITQYLTPNGQKLLDPFAGVGTTLFVGSQLGIESHGIELLAIGQWVIKTRYLLENKFTEQDFKRLKFWKNQRPWKGHNFRKNINELRITQGAYSSETQILIETYLDLLEREDDPLKTVLFFVLLCVLEDISYTRKDGQYLRWDARVDRAYGAKNFTKDKIIDFETAICNQIQDILEDTYYYHELDLFRRENKKAYIHLKDGSCLDILPTLKTEFYDIIITSPPYCNRYDYTRTYALELAMLGITEEEIIKLRQSMLSCTVESREKEMIFQNSLWQPAIDAINQQELLQTILTFLNQELEHQRLNNRGIPRMIKGYFYEMSCIIAECARVLKKGSPLIMVNDNVRYAGVQIPVDLILSDIAEKLGFETESILIISSTKGNSSQQMGTHGRISLRKCVYIWRKL